MAWPRIALNIVLRAISFALPSLNQRVHKWHALLQQPTRCTVVTGIERYAMLLLLSACRNVTVTGAQGIDTVLDMAFLHGAVQLCATCVFKFENITLTNERRGVCAAGSCLCMRSS
jgi:hypothetical protein